MDRVLDEFYRSEDLQVGTTLFVRLTPATPIGGREASEDRER
jgi:hypothetical protein